MCLDISKENNDEQEILYKEIIYYILSRGAMQKMINEKAFYKYCNGSLTIIDEDSLSQSLGSIVTILLVQNLIANQISYISFSRKWKRKLSCSEISEFNKTSAALTSE